MTDTIIKESFSLCMQLLAILSTIIGVYVVFKKMLKDVVSPIVNRLDSMDERFDRNDKRREIRVKENKIMFQAFKVVLMKMEGEHINGEIDEVKKMLDDCLIDNMR